MEATARIWNANISPKYSQEMAAAIRGLTIKRARERLEGIAAKTRPLFLKRHTAEVPHHQGRPARFPVNVAKKFIELLDNALANAQYLGGDEEKLRITEIQVYRGFHKRPRGAKATGKAQQHSRRTSVLIKLRDEK